MKALSRRQFLYIAAFFSFTCPLSTAAAFSGENELKKNHEFPITMNVLKGAYLSEMAAHKHYIAYSKKAVVEGYSNIAYLFSALAVSEKIHANNYERILGALGASREKSRLKIVISDTRANLKKAAEKELDKIKKIYPDFLAKLKKESHDQAVINCMYSWKSHRQHEEKINEIIMYSDMFFGSVVRTIEGMKLDFHVCEICGATIDEVPKTPCDICNYPLYHYQKVNPPV
jgi:rubrerythrin